MKVVKSPEATKDPILRLIKEAEMVTIIYIIIARLKEKLYSTLL